jgi:hypothetical protein
LAMSMTADARSGNSPTWACDGVVGFQGTATFGARPRNPTLLTLAFRRGPLGCCPRKTPGHLATLQPTKTNSRLFKSFPCRKNWGTLSRLDADVLRQTSPEIPHVLIGSSAGPADRRVGGMICRIHVNEQAGKALP